MESDSLSDILRNEGNSLLEESKLFDNYYIIRNKIIDSMICYEESIKLADNNTFKYKSYKNLCIANIFLFDLTLKHKEDDVDCLFHTCLELFKNYDKILFLDVNLDKNILKMKEKIFFITDQIIGKISICLKLTLEEKLSSFYQINSKLSWETPSAKNQITKFILNLQFNSGVEHYEKKDYTKSLFDLNSSLIICRERQEFQSLIDDTNEEIENLEDKENIENLIMHINFFKCIDKSDDYLKKGLFNSIEMDMNRIFMAIELCREAIQISEAISDKEIECIAYSRLLKIYHKTYKITIKVKHICNHLQILIDSLSPKSFTGEDWYEDSIKIFNSVKDHDENYEKDIQANNEELKKDFDKIQSQFKGTRKNFIKFIFNNYPPDDIPLNFDINLASNNLKKNISTIIQIFHPNKNKVPPKTFAILNEILKCLNRISDEIKEEDGFAYCKTDDTLNK